MKTRFTKLSTLLLAAAVLISLTVTARAQADISDMTWLNDPDLVSGDGVTVVIFLEDEAAQEDLRMTQMVPDMTRSARIQQVSRKLQNFRPAAYDRVSDFVEFNSTTEVVRHWIVPAFTATLTPAQVETVSAMSGIKMIVPDVNIMSLTPVEERPSRVPLAASSSSQLRMLNIPAAWSQGITGAGRLVCSFDTGVEQSHPALNSKWRGHEASLSASWMSTIAPDTLPYDKSGHGTHTMGVMVGSYGSDSIGVAPGAQWITAGVIDQGKALSATISDILMAFQWTLNPDGDASTTDDVPDVILNSWGVPSSLFGPCDATFFQAIDNVEAAGIVAIFAAGNEGPDPQTIRNPASRGSSPINSFCVGAVDNDKIVGNFSSRGPAVCGSENIKPEVVAPGVSIRSCAKGGGYVLMTGTSMAAPYIAGMVALARQYNPDATVEEIKWALIQSAQDLGVGGEDNDYGFGLPDALKMLGFLSSPDGANFVLSGTVIDGDGVAFPNEEINLQVLLTNTAGNIEQARGQLTASSEGVTVTQSADNFYFGVGGTTALSAQGFTVHMDSMLVHGQSVSFSIEVADIAGNVLDTLTFPLSIGYAPGGNTTDHDAGRIEFTISDFGQYGLAPGSIYNIEGKGFRYNGSDNLLFEAGIMMGRSDLQFSSSLRDSVGFYAPSDFEPVQSLGLEWVDYDNSVHNLARMVDANSEIAIPVTVSQETIDYSESGSDGIVVMKYYVVNSSLEPLTGISFGFLADFDLPGVSEQIEYDESLGMFCQTGESGPQIGVVGLKNVDMFRSLENGDDKAGFTREEQYDLISSGSDTDAGLSGDLLFVVGAGPFNLAPRDSVEISFALIAADSRDQLYNQASRAIERYNMPTGMYEPFAEMPAGYTLSQNYPNPFNPTTIIRFSLPQAEDVQLEVFNLLGQKVKVLRSGPHSAGTYTL
ncbi:MAG: S8 family serine peptidase, partial [bacterium]|nr:S8 family serine peptidase [bacterium]